MTINKKNIKEKSYIKKIHSFFLIMSLMVNLHGSETISPLNIFFYNKINDEPITLRLADKEHTVLQVIAPNEYAIYPLARFENKTAYVQLANNDYNPMQIYFGERESYALEQKFDLKYVFTKGFLSNYESESSYIPHKNIIFTEPADHAIAKKFGISYEEWKEPGIDFVLKFFVLNKNQLNIENLNSRSNAMVSSLNAAKQQTWLYKKNSKEEDKFKFDNKISEINSMLNFIKRAYKTALKNISADETTKNYEYESMYNMIKKILDINN